MQSFGRDKREAEGEEPALRVQPDRKVVRVQQDPKAQAVRRGLPASRDPLELLEAPQARRVQLVRRGLQEQPDPRELVVQPDHKAPLA
jgi:hypothetical protein